jgi:hypothetical protein
MFHVKHRSVRPAAVSAQGRAEDVYHFVWRDTETGEEFSKDIESESDAVSGWEWATHYINTEPVSITPEPNWSAYTYGQGPLSK